LKNTEHQQIEVIFNEFIRKSGESIPGLIIDNEQRSLKQTLEIISKHIMTIYGKLSEQNKEIEKLKKQLSTQKEASNLSDFSTSLSDQTIDAFNTWAKNPESSLPSQFSYYEGELKLREKQNIQSSSKNNSTWIMNKTGPIKYIFPNPNVIDQLSGKIDVLYTVMGNRRAKGQNKVNIQNACVIKEDGWIEYKGTLSLI